MKDSMTLTAFDHACIATYLRSLESISSTISQATRACLDVGPYFCVASMASLTACVASGRVGVPCKRNDELMIRRDGAKRGDADGVATNAQDGVNCNNSNVIMATSFIVTVNIVTFNDGNKNKEQAKHLDGVNKDRFPGSL